MLLQFLKPHVNDENLVYLSDALKKRYNTYAKRLHKDAEIIKLLNELEKDMYITRITKRVYKINTKAFNE